MKKVLAVALILCGVGLAIYGLLNFQALGGPVGNPTNLGWQVGYDVGARLEAALGAVLITAGCFLKMGKEK